MRISPISTPHTYRLVPKYGASSRDAPNSTPSDAMPETKTSGSSRRRAFTSGEAYPPPGPARPLRPGGDLVQRREGLGDVALGAHLRGEDVADDALAVDDVRHAAGQDAQRRAHAVPA